MGTPPWRFWSLIFARQFRHKHLGDAVAEIYMRVAVLLRVTSILKDQGVELCGQERYIAQAFCTRIAV